jgi:leucine dehydrogenase
VSGSDTGAITTEVHASTDAELVLEYRDEAIGYHAFVVIHSTARGPAMGGIRRMRYPDRAAALEDAVALARGMTFKTAFADLPFGGAKSVIHDAASSNGATLYRAHARVIDALNGMYVGATDLGTTSDDVARMREITRFLAAQTDPAPWTARGVRRGIQAAAMHRWGSDDLVGRTVAVQGCGAVGTHLARELNEAGASLVVADLDPEQTRRVSIRYGARVLDPDRILEADADVLAPCALGGVFRRDVIERLRVAIVAGAANNQLPNARAAQALADRGVLYVPDYAINAGGVTTAGVDLLGWTAAELEWRVDAVYERTLHILEVAARRGATPLAVADQVVADRISAAR